MAKRYIRINWQNKPSTATPLSAEFLNKMDKGIDDCDTAIEDLDGRKINSTSIVQTDQTNDTTKVPSSAVTYAHGQAISTINSNLANITDKFLYAYKATNATLISGNTYNIKYDGLTSNSDGSLLTDDGKSITLSAGFWAIDAKVLITANSNGYRELILCRTEIKLNE